jgi:hypothetical protein
VGVFGGQGATLKGNNPTAVYKVEALTKQEIEITSPTFCAWFCGVLTFSQ